MPWTVAVESTDPTRVQLDFYGHIDHSPCSPILVPIVVRETDSLVTIAQVRYFDPTQKACAAAALIGEPLAAQLSVPLGDRQILDATDFAPRTFWRQRDIPVPTYLPADIRPGAPITVSTNNQSLDEAHRIYGSDSHRLQITITRNSTPASAGTFIKDVTVSSLPAQLFSTIGNTYISHQAPEIRGFLCLRWIPQDGRTMTACLPAPANQHTQAERELIQIAESMN